MNYLQLIKQELESIQILPPISRSEINDKIAHIAFNLSPDELSKTISVIEKKKLKKVGKVKSSLSVQAPNSYSHFAPLDEFDRAVLSVCISSWIVHQPYLTSSTIYRALTGKVDKGSDSKPSKDQLDAIIKSIDKLMCTVFDADVTKAFAQLGYGDDIKIKKSPILPAQRFQAKVGGHIVDVIKLLAESPLLTIAKIKKQIITYDCSILDVPLQQNTRLNITAKNYLIRRILECKGSKKLANIITFDDLFSKCRIKDKDNKIKQRVRDCIVKFFEHLKNKGIIQAFEVTKKRNSYHSIKFDF